VRFPCIDDAVLHPVVYNENPVKEFGADSEMESICIRIANGSISACVHIKILSDLRLYKLRYVSKPLIRYAGHRITVRVLSQGIVAIIDEVG
jgi:hypothetical protein